MAGHYAYITDVLSGLQVIDVSNPAKPMRVGCFSGRQTARGVTMANGRIFLANGAAGLSVLPDVPNVHHAVRVNATPNVPFTLEATTALTDQPVWQAILTTNVASMPFDFLDLDVKVTDKPQKFYRVKQ